MENFRYAFEEVFLQKGIDRMGLNEELLARIFNVSGVRSAVSEWMLGEVYKSICPLL
ncbi:hypothetical protein [Alicyclobacillus hesperidum]|uniref:hypothetical protein n=1 Tax=Alicyclobacillus hesperidum TaxID=89784 RepID=UPI00249190EE|nr:hypothetical protein [Alicyclobacillus hesperidum]